MRNPPLSAHVRTLWRTILMGLAFVLPLLSAHQLCAQGGSAPAPFTPISGSSIDSVNLETGGLQVAIPLWSIKQRGNLSLSFTLRYQSGGSTIKKQCEEANGSGGCNSWSYPLTVSAPSVSVSDNITVSLTTVDDVIPNSDGNGVLVVGYYWQLTTPDGSTHKLASTGSGTFQATDGTGWRYNENTFILISEDGVRYVFECQFNPCPANTIPHESPYESVLFSYVEDTNGNQIHVNYTPPNTSDGLTYFGGNIVSYTDTFGRTIQAPPTPPSTGQSSGTSGCAAAPLTPLRSSYLDGAWIQW